METERDTTLAIVASLLVLFSAMFDPRVMITLSSLILLILLGYKLVEMRRRQSNNKK